MNNPMMLRNAEKNRELQLKHEAFKNAEKAASAVTQANASMREAGLGGCREALELMQEALKRARDEFMVANQVERERVERASREHVENYREFSETNSLDDAMKHLQRPQKKMNMG